MDATDAPDVRMIWDKAPKASRPHLCDRCNDEIAPGEIYESRGYVEDGEFKSEKLHRWAYRYPSGCPRIAVKDRAELDADALSELRRARSA